MLDDSDPIRSVFRLVLGFGSSSIAQFLIKKDRSHFWMVKYPVFRRRVARRVDLGGQNQNRDANRWEIGYASPPHVNLSWQANEVTSIGTLNLAGPT
jgi:hypothetical protein